MGFSNSSLSKSKNRNLLSLLGKVPHDKHSSLDRQYHRAHHNDQQHLLTILQSVATVSFHPHSRSLCHTLSFSLPRGPYWLRNGTPKGVYACPAVPDEVLLLNAALRPKRRLNPVRRPNKRMARKMTRAERQIRVSRPVSGDQEESWSSGM